MVSTRVLEAINLACFAHAAQKDKAGMPYMAHVFRVALGVEHSDEDAFIAALLHDTVEDTDVTLAQIREQFGEIVADAVDHLTRRKEETYKEFIARCAENSLALEVKLSDNEDNSRPERIATLPEGERSITKRYSSAREYLLGVQMENRVAKSTETSGTSPRSYPRPQSFAEIPLGEPEPCTLPTETHSWESWGPRTRGIFPDTE